MSELPSQKISETFRFKGKEVSILFGDITTVVADAIISSDDSHLTMSGGVSRAILQAGGDVILQEARQQISEAKLGTVLVTSAGDLQAKYVIHAIVIDFDNWQWPDVEVVRNATASCLSKANELECRTIALPAMGTGTGGLASETTAHVMIDVIFNNLERMNSLQKIILVLNKPDILFDFLKDSIKKNIEVKYKDKLDVLETEKQELIKKLREKSPYSHQPFPIAVMRRTVDSQSTYHSKFTSAIYCAESVVRYCLAVTLAACLKLEPSAGKELHDYFSQNLGFGAWDNKLADTLKFIKGKSSFSIISKINSSYFSKNKGYIRDFIDERNRTLGHGSILSEEEYKQKYETIIEKIDNVLTDMSFITEYPLIVVTQTEILENYFEYETLRIMGDNVIFPKDVLQCKDLRLSKKVLYLFEKESQQALCMHPFLVFEMCPHCKVQETFFLEKSNKKALEYHTYRVNHRMQTERYSKYFGIEV